MSESNTYLKGKRDIDSESGYFSNRGSDNPASNRLGNPEKTPKETRRGQVHPGDVLAVTAPNKESHCRLNSNNINAPEYFILLFIVVDFSYLT
jgi:hypothetical protein